MQHDYLINDNCLFCHCVLFIVSCLLLFFLLLSGWYCFCSFLRYHHYYHYHYYHQTLSFVQCHVNLLPTKTVIWLVTTIMMIIIVIIIMVMTMLITNICLRLFVHYRIPIQKQPCWWPGPANFWFLKWPLRAAWALDSLDEVPLRCVCVYVLCYSVVLCYSEVQCSVV